MTITDIKKEYFKKIDVFELDLLLEETLKKPRAFILAHGESILPPSKIKDIRSKIARRLKGEPLAYVLGHKEFYGLDFKVNKDVLVPRPETEALVEEALMVADDKKVSFIDIGTGSGCIIISLAKETRKKRQGRRDDFIGIDISSQALKIARQNAKTHKLGKNITFLKGNLLAPLLESKIKDPNSEIIIIANLPYLTPAQIKTSPSIRSEPRLALEAGRDGLRYYRPLFRQVKDLKGKKVALIIEIDPGQRRMIKDLRKKLLPGFRLRIKKDLCGLYRMAVLKNF